MFHKKNIISISVLLFCTVLLSGCSNIKSDFSINSPDLSLISEVKEPDMTGKPYSSEFVKQRILLYPNNLNLIKEKIGNERIGDFLDWFSAEYGKDLFLDLSDGARAGVIDSVFIKKLTGYSLNSLSDLFLKKLDSSSKEYKPNIHNLGNTDDKISEFGFAGDVLFSNGCMMMKYYDSRKKGIYGIADEKLVELMKSVDIMTANNEFAISNRGTPIPYKAYTFRAKPERVDIWKEMGVDLVTLGNNHVFDFGQDAFFDTLENLDKAGIHRIGAGKDIDEAGEPVYYIINGYKIAILSATRAEKTIFTPVATSNSPGVMYTYNPELFCKRIEEAKKQSDFVITIVHWGYEGTTQLETVQVDLARKLVDSGADLVIGHHAHTLQGFEYYKGKLISYNLGNFLFNSKDAEAGMLIARITENGKLETEFVTGYQKNGTLAITSGEQRAALLQRLAGLSPTVSFSENGIILPKQ